MHDENHYPPPPPPPDAMNHEDRKLAVDQLIAKFENIEGKVRTMEDQVTSKEFILNQKFKNL